MQFVSALPPYPIYFLGFLSFILASFFFRRIRDTEKAAIQLAFWDRDELLSFHGRLCFDARP